MKDSSQNTENYRAYKGVWVFIEQIAGHINPVSWELLGEGRKLVDKLAQVDSADELTREDSAGGNLPQLELAGVLLGSEVSDLTSEVFAMGADKVYLVDHPVLARYRTAPYKDVLVQLINKYRPEIFLMGATALGRDLSGTLATELETGLTADCTVLDIEQGSRNLEQTRPAFGGNIMATILCKERRPQMATVRPRVMSMPERVTARSGQVVSEEVDLREEDSLTQIVDYLKDIDNAVYLDKAEIIVAGGKGVGSARNWSLIEDLASTLGGMVGATRAAIEAGWTPVEHQIGQSGQTVRPKIYFAIGISGAIQHVVGMQTSDIIIAINNNSEAPIFKLATYGLVGDLNTIVPALTKEFATQLKGRGQSRG